MKFYFTSATDCFIATFTDISQEPAHIASFPVAEGQSTFCPRYALVNAALVDQYVGKSDEEVAAAIKAANDAEAERLAALHAPKT